MVGASRRGARGASTGTATSSSTTSVSGGGWTSSWAQPRLGGTLADNRGSHFDGAVTWPIDDPRQEIRIVDFTNIDIVAQPNTKKFQSAQITLIDEHGTEYDLEFEIIKPNSTRHIRGEGYGQPRFLGGWQGNWHEEFDKYDLSDYSTFDSFAHQLWDGEHAVRCRFNGREGIGAHGDERHAAPAPVGLRVVRGPAARPA